MKYVDLSYLHVGLAAGLILVSGLVSVALSLKLGRSLLLASVRTILSVMRALDEALSDGRLKR